MPVDTLSKVCIIDNSKVTVFRAICLKTPIISFRYFLCTFKMIHVKQYPSEK